jgi:hypothetical protein
MYLLPSSSMPTLRMAFALKARLDSCQHRQDVGLRALFERRVGFFGA